MINHSAGVDLIDTAEDADAIAAMIGDYQLLPGACDELVDASGNMRSHWRPLISALSELGPEGVSDRFEAADRHMRDSGVFHRIHGDDPAATERAWPLSHLPLVLGHDEWELLKAGMIERACLIEHIISDAYGPASLVANGVLPAAVIAGSPEFLRPLVGVKPVGGSYLSLYAADIGRGPDGRWWVLSDRTQAPSGAGYALENRMALSRALPEIYRSLNIERLAGFFQQFRAALAQYNTKEDARIGVLTPGPLSETYFEHAYLARYLGFLLIEGEDLTVRGDEMFVRTVSGLKPASVLWRRLDSDFADPLELNPRSRLGVPGLVHAIRKQTVFMGNALGTGIAEAQSLMSFIPVIARYSLGGRMALPNIATWWCGQKRERDFVLENFESLAIAPAYTHSSPGLFSKGAVLGSDMDKAEKQRVKDAITRRGVDYVGQEVVKLSTMPVWHDGVLKPRPFSLRLFVAKTQQGWTVMPGGFCRVSDTQDARAITMQAGGRSADVWITSNEPVAQTTLLPTPEQVTIRRRPGSLPSRAAENLFWLGRYLERTEATLRVLRVLSTRGADAGAGHIVELLRDLLKGWGAIDEDSLATNAGELITECLTDKTLYGALPALARSAQGTASVIRDRFSPDAWRALHQLKTRIDSVDAEDMTEAEAYERINEALQIIAAISGLAQENMNRLNGWRFLDIGRRIERGIVCCRLIRKLALNDAAIDTLWTLLELADSQITYQIRYFLAPTRAPVVDLLALDHHNPRSLAFQVNIIEQQLSELPSITGDGLPSKADRLATRLAGELRAADAETLTPKRMSSAEAVLMRISDEVSLCFFRHRDLPVARDDFA